MRAEINAQLNVTYESVPRVIGALGKADILYTLAGCSLQLSSWTAQEAICMARRPNSQAHIRSQPKKGRILGDCGYPFMTLTKCNTCKRFDDCYQALEDSMKTPNFSPVVKEDLLKSESWKSVNSAVGKGKNLKLKLQAKKGVN